MNKFAKKMNSRLGYAKLNNKELFYEWVDQNMCWVAPTVITVAFCLILFFILMISWWTL